MNAKALCLAVAALLAGCATSQTVVEADPVIAGTAYVNRPMTLGRVKMRMDLHPQALESQGEGPAPGEQVDLTLGFATTGEPASVVARSGTLRSRKDGAEAVLTARFQAGGTALGCVPTIGAELAPDYWFNGMATDQWKCVTLRFRLPGRKPTDPLELTFEPISVGGAPMRLLPVTFAFRTVEIETD